MQSTSAIDPTMSVNEMIAKHPETIAVFNRFGIDTCCGGAASIDEAAHRDAVDREAFLEALRTALALTGT